MIKSHFEDFLDSPLSDSLDDLTASTVKSENNTVKKELTSPIFLDAHMNGTVIKLEDVPDEAFSQKVLGDGAAIDPSEGKLFAPCDGTITTVFETKHAINFISKNGAEILLHVGIDTVKLNGKHFTAHVKNGQTVKKGDLLLSFDINSIKKAGYQLVTPLVVCNRDEYSKIETIADKTVKSGDHFIKIR